MNNKTTILVIDDETALRTGLAAVLKRNGYDVIIAGDGKEGLEKAKESLPDLILSDVMMPPPNGFELRKIMSQDDELSPIPFIFLTARTGVEDRVSGIRDGADDYITKPFETEELLARIEALLRRVKREQAYGREQMKAATDQEMETLKREILQNYHHELRTPLTNILMPLQLAEKNKFNSPEELNKFIKLALSNVDRLDSLVADLILLSNIDYGNLNCIRQPTEIGNHIIKNLERRLDRYKKKELKFLTEIDSPEEISVPRREFIQAVVHLADNAFKFSPIKGNVKFVLKSNANSGVAIQVHDDGPGIQPALREKVFDRYFQSSRGNTRENEGLGVGLTIARAVFESLGGYVEIADSAAGCSVRAVIPDIRPEDTVYE